MADQPYKALPGAARTYGLPENGTQATVNVEVMDMTQLAADTHRYVAQQQAEATKEAARCQHEAPAQEETKRTALTIALLAFCVVMMCAYSEARTEIAILTGGLGTAEILRKAFSKK